MNCIDIDSKINYFMEYSRFLKKVKRTGDKVMALCPFHNDTNLSFSVDLKTGKYNCFGCDEKGNYITFRSKIDNVNTDEAYKIILKELGISDEEEAARKRIYTIKNYCHEKQFSSAWLVEDWKMGDYRNGIKIPYLDEAGKEITTRYRYASKMFTWSKGAKVCLYGLHKLSEIQSKGYVVLVEGESDTHTLWFHNIPALGVPGASTFKPEWVEILKGLKVYIHHEGDVGAVVFERTICKALHAKEFEGEVFRIGCKNVGAKDPSELHCADIGAFKGKWEAVMSMAQALDVEEIVTKAEELVPGMPIRLRQPVGWVININGVHSIDNNTGIAKCICRTPVLISGRMCSLDTGEEKVEVSFYRDSKWRSIIYPRSTVFQCRTITQLADIGITVTSESARYLVKFLGALEAENIDFLPIKKSLRQLGWFNKSFLPFSKEEGLVIDVDRNSMRWLNAYSCKSTLQEWVSVMGSYRKNHIFRFMMAASFAAPLLKLINHRVFFIHNWADSRSGKTAALKAALGVWGNCEDLMVTFNATRVGLERIAGFYNDLPLGIDERQVGSSDQQFMDNLIYMLGIGGSKLRGTKTGGMQNMTSWKTIVLTTGEEPLWDTTSQTGVATRVVELYGAPFNGESEARRMHDIAPEIYGTAGPKFVERLTLEHGEDWDKLKHMHAYVQRKLSQNCSNKMGTHVSAVALVVLADILSGRWIFEDNDEEASYNMGISILSGLETDKDSDVIEKVYAYIKSWAIANSNNFNKDSKPCYGTIREEQDAYYIFPYVLEDLLVKKGYSYRKTLKGLGERGYIYSDKDKNQITFRYYGKYVKFVALKVGELECPF